jgi:uncharacterized protein involved in exopolysaccharide biosynthesis
MNGAGMATEPIGAGNVREIMRGPPSGYFIVIPEAQQDGASELATLPAELLAAWKLLLATTLLGALLAGGMSYLMPAMYRAQALVVPVTQKSSSPAGGALSELSGLASLAGVDIGISGGRKEEYLATLDSPGFARQFIESQNLLPLLYADRWDPQAKRWRPGEKVPTLGQAVKRFTREVVSITDDRRTNVVTVTVDWYSPQLAAQWANGMIEQVNDRLRADAVHTADSSLEYLNNELAKTNVVEVRQAIYRVIEQQVNNAMLANTQHEYAFHFVDRAIAPETRYSPKRVVMAAIGAAVGLFLGFLLVYARRARARQRATAAPRSV